MASGKKRNPLNLSLPPTVNEESSKDETTDESNLETSIDNLQNLTLSQPQVQRMNEWISQKRQVDFV